MTRKRLTEAIAQAAAEGGYCFHAGPDYRLANSIVAYPAAWLCPPKIVAIEGRHEGRVRYRALLHLMRLADKHPRKTDPAPDPWQALEADALALRERLLDNHAIRSIALTECAPAEFSLTPHGEISMSMSMEVEVGFCNL